MFYPAPLLAPTGWLGPRAKYALKVQAEAKNGTYAGIRHRIGSLSFNG